MKPPSLLQASTPIAEGVEVPHAPNARRSRRWLWLIPLVAALAACGGGGSGGGGGADTPSATAAVVDVATAWRKLLTANQTWVVSGKGSDNRDYTLTLESAPGGAGVYPLTGQAGTTTLHRATLRVGGVSETATMTNVVDAAGQLVGVIYDDGTCESVQAPNSAVPGPSAVGSSGALATGTEYAPCRGGASALNAYTWSVQNDAGVTLFCVDQRSTDMAGVLLGTEQQCFEAAPNGTLGVRARFTITVPGALQLVTRNF